MLNLIILTLGVLNVNKRWTINEIREFVEKNSTSKLLTTEYKGFSQKLLFQCECGETYEKTFKKFKENKQRGCVTCCPPRESR